MYFAGSPQAGAWNELCAWGLGASGMRRLVGEVLRMVDGCACGVVGGTGTYPYCLAGRSSFSACISQSPNNNIMHNLNLLTAQGIQKHSPHHAARSWTTAAISSPPRLSSTIPRRSKSSISIRRTRSRRRFHVELAQRLVCVRGDRRSRPAWRKLIIGEGAASTRGVAVTHSRRMQWAPLAVGVERR